jgi:hypothetical protein
MSGMMQNTGNNTSVVTSNGSCGGISAPTPRGGGGTAISPAATPGSYMYTSSSSLLRSSTGEKAVPRAVPPPTLPKYTGGSSSFRLASLDRLAHRQRQFDQQQGSLVTAAQVNGDASAITSPSQQQQSAVSCNACQESEVTFAFRKACSGGRWHRPLSVGLCDLHLVYVCVTFVCVCHVRQRLGKNITAATDTYAATEKVLNASVSVLSMLCQRNVGVSSPQDFLLFLVSKCKKGTRL